MSVQSDINYKIKRDAFVLSNKLSEFVLRNAQKAENDSDPYYREAMDLIHESHSMALICEANITLDGGVN